MILLGTNSTKPIPVPTIYYYSTLALIDTHSRTLVVLLDEVIFYF